MHTDEDGYAAQTSKTRSTHVSRVGATAWIIATLRRQLLQQRLRLFQIARVEPLSEPPVNRSQQFARLPHLALVTQEAREAHGGAEFPGFGLLLAGDVESPQKTVFTFGLLSPCRMDEC